MSEEQEAFIKNGSLKADPSYDAVLILMNPEIYHGHSLTPIKKPKTKFYDIFRLNEYQDETRAKIKDLSSSLTDTRDCIPLKELYLLILKSIEIVIKDILKLDYQIKLSISQEEYYILLKASEHNLMVQADLIEFVAQLKKNPDENLDFQKVSPYAIFKYNDKRNLFRKYDENDSEMIDPADGNCEKGTFFKKMERISLIRSMLYGELRYEILLNLGIVINYMPLHNYKNLERIINQSGKLRYMFTSPLKKIDYDMFRDYFGEEITFYFCWLQNLTYFLAPLSVFSLVFGVLFIIVHDEDDDSPGINLGEAIIISFAIFGPILSTIYEQMWLRRESYLNWKWGTKDMSLMREQRPEFEGEYGTSPVTGKYQKIPKGLLSRRIIAKIFMFLIILFDVLVYVLLFYIRSRLNNNTNLLIIFGVVNGILISILNSFYQFLAVKLNNWENYEYINDYNDTLARKLFIFQFINSYSSFFYIAFAKDDLEGCKDDSCIHELELQFQTTFVTIVLLNTVEILSPIITSKYKIWKETSQRTEYTSSEPLSHEEYLSKLNVYEGTISEYMEVVITFGYFVLFGACFPLAVLLLLLYIIIEIRIDSWKLCNFTQRPYPNAADSIGIWISITQILSLIGCGTNIGLIIFTTNAFNLDSDEHKWILFLIMEHLLIIFKFLVDWIIPDVPDLVRSGLIWSQRVADERIYGKVSTGSIKESKNLEFIRTSTKEN
jgi:Calcium-activated chloride channel